VVSPMEIFELPQDLVATLEKPPPAAPGY